LRIEYRDNAHIGLAVRLENRSRSPLVLLGARVTDKGRRLIRQIGSSFELVQERPCPESCPATTYLRYPYGPGAARPLDVPAGRVASVQLDFLVSGCGRIPPGPKTYARTLDVAYRAKGRLRHQLVAMGSDRLEIYAPDAAYCRQTKHSGLVVLERDVTTGSDWSTPVGHGDDCTLRRGVLTFESRPMQVHVIAPRTDLLRVRFTIRGYRGLESYQVDRARAARHRVTVTTVGPNGTRVAAMGHVLVVGASGSTVHGRLQAEFSPGWPRAEDRVYGSWWCTVAP
jgi:hypothetical protein